MLRAGTFVLLLALVAVAACSVSGWFQEDWYDTEEEYWEQILKRDVLKTDVKRCDEAHPDVERESDVWKECFSPPCYKKRLDRLAKKKQEEEEKGFYPKDRYPGLEMKYLRCVLNKATHKEMKNQLYEKHARKTEL